MLNIKKISFILFLFFILFLLVNILYANEINYNNYSFEETTINQNYDPNSTIYNDVISQADGFDEDPANIVIRDSELSDVSNNEIKDNNINNQNNDFSKPSSKLKLYNYLIIFIIILILIIIFIIKQKNINVNSGKIRRLKRRKRRIN